MDALEEWIIVWFPEMDILAKTVLQIIFNG